ncbi:MAG: GRP family sugar transporter [Gammaproteobacteria bacterium]|nr:GRP family sugar transporter [Gammaproteobacteria bacterium]
MNWVSAAFVSLFSFGVWGLLTKLAVLHIDARSALIYQTLGVVIIAIITLGLINFKPASDVKGISYGILTGLAYGIGCLFYFMAASKGKIITVVTLTALYPLVTIILAYLFLQETVSMKQCLGIGLAFVAILLMSA